MELQDLLVDFDSLTEFEDSTFLSLERQSTNIIDEDIVVEILVTLSANLNFVERYGYTILDYLSDIGGISGLVFSGVSSLLAILNANFFDNFMVSKLFKFRDTSEETKDEKSTFI